jgi:hypothetical protein
MLCVEVAFMVCSIVRAETDRQLLRQMINYGKNRWSKRKSPSSMEAKPIGFVESFFFLMYYRERLSTYPFLSASTDPRNDHPPPPSYPLFSSLTLPLLVVAVTVRRLLDSGGRWAVEALIREGHLHLRGVVGVACDTKHPSMVV